MPVAEEPHAAREELVGTLRGRVALRCCYTWCMALVSPFVGLLFDGSIVGSHDLVTTPPYDVISDDERRHYLDASPYNVIRLVLGRDDAGEGGTVDKYRQAASELETWRARCARPDRAPVVLPVRDAVLAARPAPRDQGMVCAVELEDPGGSIVPHEQTMPGPIEDASG